MARIGDRGEMEAFVRAVELGGFSAAARDLKLTPSALSKLVTRLEKALKVRLLSRTTRERARKSRMRSGSRNPSPAPQIIGNRGMSKKPPTKTATIPKIPPNRSVLPHLIP